VNPAIELDDVHFAWRGQPDLLHIVHLSVAAGERVFLKGPSGSGKSTLLGLMGGVLVPRSGSIRLIGTSLTELGASARDRFRGEHIGFIFQMFNLIPYLSVRENVLLPLAFSPARRERITAPTVEVEALRCSAHWDWMTRTCSAGPSRSSQSDSSSAWQRRAR
jgi:putative ABC transport system ATP-binding protein